METTNDALDTTVSHKKTVAVILMGGPTKGIISELQISLQTVSVLDQ